MSEHDDTTPTSDQPPVQAPAVPAGPAGSDTNHPQAAYAEPAPVPRESRWRRAAARVPRGRGVLAGVATFVGVLALLGSFALGRVTADGHDLRGGSDDHGGQRFEPTADRDGDGAAPGAGEGGPEGHR